MASTQLARHHEENPHRDIRGEAAAGSLELIIVKCGLCGADDYEPVATQRQLRMVQCRHCGLVYLNPRPTEGWLEGAYQEYLPVEHDAVANWNRMMAGLYASARMRLIRRLPAGGSLLDVGSAYGRFLDIMRSAGWQVEGLEIMAPAVAASRRRGLPVIEKPLGEARLQSNRYDAVTMFYVLEHLPQPVEGLQKVFDALKPGGVAIVRIPDTTPLVRLLGRLRLRNELYDPPFHLFDFSPVVLERALNEVGFVNVQIEIDAASRPRPLGPRFISLSSSFIARTLQRLTRGRYLLPGVSKTAIAEKPGGSFRGVVR